MRYTTAGKILVVDDEPLNVEVFSRLMLRLGYEVLTASNGESALESVAAGHPDLILLDVNMPSGGIDGFEVCRRLKSDPKTRLIPIVLITGLTAIEDRIKGIEAGADDFLAKPPVIAELEARVRSLTRLKRYTDELDSAESVILSLGLTMRATPTPRVIASGWRSTRPRWARVWGSTTTNWSPCIAAGSCTMSAKWRSPTPCC
jgi:CheY-like chemotaxis protein